MGDVTLAANMPGGGSLQVSGINPTTVLGAATLLTVGGIGGWWLCSRYHKRR